MAQVEAAQGLGAAGTVYRGVVSPVITRADCLVMDSVIMKYMIIAGGFIVTVILLSAFGVIFYIVAFGAGALFGFAGGFILRRR